MWGPGRPLETARIENSPDSRRKFLLGFPGRCLRLGLFTACNVADADVFLTQTNMPGNGLCYL